MSPQPPPFPPGQMPPGMQRPTPEQIAELQRRVAEDAQKAGMTVPEFIEHIEWQAMEQRMRAQHDHHHDCDHDHHDHHGPDCNHGHGSQPIAPGPPNPKALAVATFLKGQELKPRTCILNGERKDMFKGTRPGIPAPRTAREC